MKACLMCQQMLRPQLNLTTFFSFTKLFPAKLCSRCYEQLIYLKNQACCQSCHGLSEVPICSDCMEWRKIYPDYSLNHQALFRYNDWLKDFFQQFKFQGNASLAGCFQKEIYHALHSYAFKKNWLLVPVPISEEKRLIRGFNQVELLLEQAGLPYTSLLEKKQETSAQSHKNKIERLQMVQPFRVKQEAIPQLVNKKIIVIDDVYTTGRTLLHAVMALKKHSDQPILTFSLAR